MHSIYMKSMYHIWLLWSNEAIKLRHADKYEANVSNDNHWSHTGCLEKKHADGKSDKYGR